MTNLTNIQDDLKKLWASLMDNPPAKEQFEVWLVLHTPDVVKRAIAKTAAKNLSLGKTMTDEYKLRFASKVMLTQTERRAEHTANKEKLNAEFAAKAGGQ